MAEVADTCPYTEADLTRLFELEPKLVECPYPLYEALREHAPVVYNDRLKGFVVTRYDDVVAVLREPEIFSSAMASGPSSVTGLAKQILDDSTQPPKLRQQAARRLKMSESPVLIFTDPPLHKRQRMLVSAAFNPRRVSLLEPEVRRLTSALIDDFVGEPQVEIVSRFSIQLPMTVIATLLGVPPENMAIFKRWSNAFTQGVGALDHSSGEIEEIFDAVDDFYDYFTEQIEQRRSQPKDDLLTDLVAARMDGEEPLSLNEILQMLVQFLVAGNETTTNMLTTLLLRLAQDPELQERVRKDPSLVPALVDEALRLEAPVQGLFRTATQDTLVGDVPVLKGSLLWLAYGSANRDPRAFDDADSIVLDEERAPHLAFARGEHFCIGANIAKLELRVAVELLLGRLHDIALACDPDEVRYHRSFILRGIPRLPIRFTAAV